MITLHYEEGGVQKALELTAEKLSDLRPVFGRFTKYMRGEVDEVFSSQGNGEWPARAKGGDERQQQGAAAKIEKIRSNQYGSLRSSLRSSMRKAERRLEKTPQSDSKLTARRHKSIARYQAQIAEVARVEAGGARADKGNKVLYERMNRREARAQKKIEAVESGALLGAIANSITVDFDTKIGWSMQSKIPWAGAQNDGGRVGHGAVLPARTFLEWTPERIAMFVQMAEEHMLKGLEGGARN